MAKKLTTRIRKSPVLFDVLTISHLRTLFKTQLVIDKSRWSRMLYFIELKEGSVPNVQAVDYWKLGGLIHTHTFCKADQEVILPRLRLK